jgi:electron transfer flavoprotein alpha subunit
MSTVTPWAVLAPSTAWSREVAARAAARTGSGLTGDAVGLEVDVLRSRLVAWKPAFGGQLVAAVEALSPVQMATVRVGVLPAPEPRVASTVPRTIVDVAPRGRVDVLARTRDDDLDALAAADAVVGVGRGVDPSEYDDLRPLLAALHAELGATRKVTDAGWLPRARQIGITGRSIAPRLYVSIGASGKFNHMVGVRAAGTVLAINPDPDALVFRVADVGIVADWHDVVPALVAELTERSGVEVAE